MFTDRPEHLKGFDYLGCNRYFLTFCTDQRHHAFTVADHVELVRSHILRTADDCGFAIIAYCFMPDHLHLLIEGRHDGADCRAFIKRAKQFSGYYYARIAGRRLWQRYGYERTLRRDEANISVARYILENPLRAGLVRRVQDYPFTGSSHYSMDELLDAIQSASSWDRSG